jgi:single-strand DNA-binding protein
MATGLNRATIIGNLCADPEVRTTGSGTEVCNIRVAVNERRKINGEWADAVEYVSAVCFGRTATNVGQYLNKGSQVYLEGRLQTRKWQDKTGADRWSTEVVCDEVKFLGGKGNSDGGGYAAPKPKAADYDEGIPF